MYIYCRHRDTHPRNAHLDYIEHTENGTVTRPLVSPFMRDYASLGLYIPVLASTSV